jgi:hypothetical protein
VGRAIRRAAIGALTDFVPPQLTAPTESAPEGGDWADELKWDGCRQARIESRNVRLLIRTGLDWTDKYPTIVRPFAHSGSGTRTPTRPSSVAETARSGIESLVYPSPVSSRIAAFNALGLDYVGETRGNLAHGTARRSNF